MDTFLRRDVIALIRRGATSQARERVRAASAASPAHDAQAWLEFATLHGMIGDYEACAYACRQALSQSPDLFLAWYQLGMALGIQQQNEDAEAALREAIRRSPSHAGAHNGLGNVLREQGRSAEAELSYRAALDVQPSFPAALANLGNLLRTTGRGPEALGLLQRAAALSPCNAVALLGLGRVLGEAGRLTEERKCYEQLVSCQPENAAAWAALGSVCARTGQLADAVESCERALILQPEQVEARVTKGFVLQRRGRRDDAAQLYREALARDPHHPSAGHLLATLDAEAKPARASASYVRALFDDYAERFDRHLVGSLGYRTPELLEQLVRPLLSGVSPVDILDLGCGTGLAGSRFQDLARRLAGVDLSPRMIEKARERDIYTDLRVGDVFDALDAEPAAYDLIVAADVLVYLGDLAPLMRGVARALRPGSLFAFSAETSCTTDTFELRDSGRYAQADAYVRTESERAGLAVEHTSMAVLRKDAGTDVAGCLYVLRKR